MTRVLLILALVSVLAPMKLVRDPFCGTWVPPAEALALRTGHEIHYFCSVECREAFRKSA